MTSQQEAADLAKAIGAHVAAGYLEAEGVAKGNPAIKAGSKVKIDGIGTSFGGTYVVSSCTHLFQGTPRVPRRSSRPPAARRAASST